MPANSQVDLPPAGQSPQVTASRKAYETKLANAMKVVPVRMLPDGRLTRKDAAAYLGVTEKTLANWHSAGKLRARKVGGRCFYFKDDLDNLVGEGAE